MKGAYSKKTIYGKKGSTNLIMICTSILVLVISAVISDFGNGEIQYFNLKKDAKIIVKGGSEELLKSKENALDFTKQFAIKIVNDLNRLDVNISDSGKQMSVYLGRPYNYRILGLIGMKKRQLNTIATVKISNISSFKGARPIAIEKRDLVFGKRLKLSNKNEDNNDTLKYINLVLGNSGFEKNIELGYNGKLKIGDLVGKYTGDTGKEKDYILELLDKCIRGSKCSYLNYEMNCPRIIVIPVVGDTNVSVTKGIIIDGFAAFYIEDCYSTNSETVLAGRFIKMMVDGSQTNDSYDNFGLYGFEVSDKE